jgi:hypothetical protein|tara:strand:- start:284 stop:562 length:279 start_codon:yes stop_codon:yes gene_type:complete
MSTKKPYTEDQIRYILDNYINNEDSCVRKTGHSLGSIKLMLQNIAATYGLVNFGTGNPMYTKIADEYRERKKVHGETMTKKSFCMRFGIIKH